MTAPLTFGRAGDAPRDPRRIPRAMPHPSAPLPRFREGGGQ